jgi:alpha-amylase
MLPLPVTLLLGVHAHQPIGNFPAVIEEAHVRCYRPFLQMLARFPAFRFSVHLSGWLMDELARRHPEDIALLAAMVGRGQVEMFGSGEYEPVLAAIPHCDRVAQLEAMSHKLARRFGTRPHGAWLTERVWESGIVPALAATGIRYVVVDDYHFLAAGCNAAELDRFFTTEEDAARLDLFPISEALRYRFPFAPASEAIAYLESLADQGHQAAIYFDDIEKFGIWPETYEWVYGKGWLEEFIRGVLASPKIRTATYHEFHAASRTRGVVYLPTTSYIEMNEWTLGPGAAERYLELVHREKEGHRYEATKAFVRGGIWRNFFSRYPEANWMHKRMLALSARAATLRPSPAVTELLHQAQANDAYWHGLFGGLYLPHLRRAVWRSLVALERELDALAPRELPIRGDVDLDGVDEVQLANQDLQVVLRLDGLGAAVELDSYRLGHNFGDTLRRIAEPYYGLIAAAGVRHSGSGIASAHDRVELKHAIEPHDLVPDAHGRMMLIDAMVDSGGAPTTVADYAVASLAPELVAFASRGADVEKRVAIEGDALVVRYRCPVRSGTRWVVTLSLAMPSADGYAGRYILADGSMPCGFGQRIEQPEVARVALDDGELRGALFLECDPPARLTGGPHHTVSRSEGGFERIMQAVTVVLDWPLEPTADAAQYRELHVVLRPSAHAQ